MNSIRFFFRRGCVAAAALIGTVALFVGPSPSAAQTPPPTADVLGFSRYLPEDVDGYVSLVQMGHVIGTIGESNAWKQIEEVPEIKAALSQLRAARSSPDVPPPVHMALALLQAAGETEVTVAVRPDLSKNLLGVARLGLLSFGGFAPSRHEPDSPEGFALGKKQSEFRQEWAKTVATIGIPSIVVAARVREPAKYEFFVQGAIQQLRQALLAETNKKAPPELRPVLESILTPVEIGKAKLWRFHLRLGDIVPPAAVAGQLARSPLGAAEREAVAAAAANLTFDVHLGFVGEYLTLVLSSNDDLIRQIVERHEGRSTATLAASQAFAPIRADASSKTIGILYGDATASLAELKQSVFPLLRSVTDREFLAMIGAPDEIPVVIDRVRKQLEDNVDATPLKQYSVLQFEQGLQQVSRSEIEREPVPPATTPLASLGAVPANSIGFVAWREASLDVLWEQVRFGIAQTESQMVIMQKRYADSPEYLATLEHARAFFRQVLRSIDEKVAPATRGETAVLVGPFVPFAVEGPAGRELPQFSVPSAALVIQSSAPDRAVEGLLEIYRAIQAVVQQPDRPAVELPVSFEAKDVDGLEARVLTFKEAPMRGIEPHVARIGNRLVISSSFELTKQIRDAAEDRSPAIASTPAYQAVQRQLPVTAHQLVYLDGETLNRSVRATAEQIFSFVDANSEKFRMSERDRREFAVVRRFVDVGLNAAATFRRAYGSLVAEGRTNVLREWVRFEDLPSR